MGGNQTSMSASLSQESYLFKEIVFPFSLLIDDVLESFPQYLGFHISVSEDPSGLLLGVLQNESDFLDLRLVCFF